MRPSDIRATELLGQNLGNASVKLYRQMLFHFVQQAAQNTCYRCDEAIENVEEFSLEHKESWQSAADPTASYFDLYNITFSHLRCNAYAGGAAKNAAKTHCPQGHEYTVENTYRYRNNWRYCRTCKLERERAKTAIAA